MTDSRSPVINYDAQPRTRIHGFDEAAWAGYPEIASAIRTRVTSVGKAKSIVAVECYPGTADEELLPALQKELGPDLIIPMADAQRSHSEVNAMLAATLTEDRVRGFMRPWCMADFLDPDLLSSLQQSIARSDAQLILVYGTGATLAFPPDVLIYADLARWEIQLRYRRGEIANWCAENRGEDFLRMYKRGYFVDWRVADQHKSGLFDQVDFLLDTNRAACPKMVTGDAFRAGLRQVARQPFRLVPYFDAGPWGGNWMQERFGLDSDFDNFAWGFDGVPEENSLLLDYGSQVLEVPAMNLVLYQSRELLGDAVVSRFGAEFPIRFDLLDTMNGGNLSLQVHPTTKYIREHFGMSYTQDESYYLLDAGENAVVYLGTKSGISPERMIADLQQAQQGGLPFDAEKYVNAIPAKKHDHFLIPAGTIHCSGRDSMVLEISATPYIFTFKLWDWGRTGLDGKPRPIHIEHGEKVIDYSRNTPTVLREHVNCVEPIAEGEGWREERTGLHPAEFIESRRHWFTGIVPHDTEGTVHVLNLVAGREAVVESPVGSFKPFVVHYAETFIVPASVGPYTIRPLGGGSEGTCATMKAYVRSEIECATMPSSLARMRTTG